MRRRPADPPGSTLVLAAVCIAGLMLPLSVTGTATAVADIGRDIGGGAVALSWVVNAYNVAFASFVMAAGALADQVGRKRIFAIGTALFAVASLVCGLAPSVVVLDVSRAVQGLGAGLSLTAGTAILAQVFTGAARVRAFGFLGSAFGIGLAAGPLTSGAIIAVAGWRWVFLINVFVGAAVLAFGLPKMRESRDPAATGIDWAGTATFTGSLSMLTFGIVLGPQLGWVSATVILLFAGSMALMLAFVVVERRQTRPMLDLSIFRIPTFLGISVLQVGTGFCYVALLVFVPAYAIGVQNYSALQGGLFVLPLTAPTLVVPLLAAAMARKVPMNVLLGVGMTLIAAGALWLGLALGADAGMSATVLPLLLIGIGAGIPWGLMDGVAVSVVPSDRAGMAAGIFTTQRIGQEAIGIAVVGAIVVSVVQSRLASALTGFTSPLADSPRALANEVVAGRVADAADTVSLTDRAAFIDLLTSSYTEGFATAAIVLAAIGAAVALAQFSLIRHRDILNPESEVTATDLGHGPAGRLDTLA